MHVRIKVKEPITASEENRTRCDFFELLQPGAAGYARRNERVHKAMMGEVCSSLSMPRQFATLGTNTYGTSKTQHGDQNMVGQRKLNFRNWGQFRV